MRKEHTWVIRACDRILSLNLFFDGLTLRLFRL